MAIDDIPMSNCTVDEAARLLQTCHGSLKIHLKKRNAIGEKKLSCNEESIFSYTVELKPNNEPLGLLIDDDMKVVGMQKNGLCWR